jgi:hypothetical protein
MTFDRIHHVHFGHVFIAAGFGAACTLVGVWLAMARVPALRQAQQVPIVLSACQRVSPHSAALFCSADVPVLIYRQPQTTTPAGATAGVE